MPASPLKRVLVYGRKLQDSKTITISEAVTFAALEASASSVVSFVEECIGLGSKTLTAAKLYKAYASYCRDQLWEAYTGHRFEKLFDQAVAKTYATAITKTSGKSSKTRSTSLYTGIAVKIAHRDSSRKISEAMASELLWQPDSTYNHKRYPYGNSLFQPLTNGKGTTLQYGGEDYDPPDTEVERIRYFQPIPFRGEKERYHFCALEPHEGVPRPVGYCATECAGHDTEEEAREHFRQFMLDSLVRWRRLSQPCRICGTITTDCAMLGFTISSGAQLNIPVHKLSIPFHDLEIPLCPAHLNRTVVEQIFQLSNFHELIYY